MPLLNLSNDSVKRLRDVIRTVEGTPLNGTGKALRGPVGTGETIWGRITSVGTGDDAGHYEYEEVSYNADDDDWETVEDGRTGTFALGTYAFTVDDQVLAENDVRLMRRAPARQGEDWVVRWAISGGGSGSGAIRFRVTTAGPIVPEIGDLTFAATPEPAVTDIGDDPVDVIATMGYQDSGAIIWAIPVDNVPGTYIQIPVLPFSTNKYELLQVDASGRYLIDKLRLL